MNLKQLKDIRDNKPEGATHFSYGENCFYKKSCGCNGFDYCLYGKSHWQYDSDDNNVYKDASSLSDINAQIELIEEIERLKEDNKRLTQNRNGLAFKLGLLRSACVGEDSGEIYLDITAESERVALYDDISEPLEQLAQHDKQTKENTVADFCCWLIDNGEPIPEEELQVMGSKFLESYDSTIKGAST